MAQRHTCYVYDTDWNADTNQWRSGMAYTPSWTIPAQYETRNNRLLEYCEFDTSATPQRLMRTVHYTYYETGNVSNITLKDEYLGTGDVPDEYTWHYDLALSYTTGGNLRCGVWGRWRTVGGHTTYQALARRQFFYDGYNLVRMRDVDPATLLIDPTYPETETWRDYFGGEVYGDFQVDVTPGTPYVATATDQQAYLAGPGLAQQDADGANTRYHHGDLLDSSMLLTDDAGAAVSAVSYTAFGELIISGAIGGEFSADMPRYAYAAAWGYESGHYQDPPEGSSLPGFTDLLALYGPNGALAPVTLQHVGWRWYQPGAGRFVQRDPLGLDGGPNVYSYRREDSLSRADPLGFTSVAPPGGGAMGPLIGEFEREMARVMRWLQAAKVAGRYVNPIKVRFMRLRLADLQWIRNCLYSILGEGGAAYCLLVGTPVAGGYAGAAAGHAAQPYIDAAAEWYRRWTYGGRGGFRPGELWD